MKHMKTLFLLALCAALLLSGCGGDATPAVTGAPPNAAGTGTELEIYCFSAGAADAFLLYTARSAVLIDAGEKGFGKEILAYMEAAGIGALDYLIITHFDKDHVGGAAKVVNSVPVGTVLQSNSPKDSDEYENYCKAIDNAGLTPVTVTEDFTFTLDGVAYTVDGPAEAVYDKDPSNNSSLVVSVWNGSNSLLFMGDAEDARAKEFLAGNSADYDFLKVPHHGRWQDTLTALLASAKPEYAVITSSESEPEDKKTLALLEQKGVETFLTRSAPVLVRCDGTELAVEYAA